MFYIAFYTDIHIYKDQHDCCICKGDEVREILKVLVLLRPFMMEGKVCVAGRSLIINTIPFMRNRSRTFVFCQIIQLIFFLLKLNKFAFMAELQRLHIVDHDSENIVLYEQREKLVF